MMRTHISFVSWRRGLLALWVAVGCSASDTHGRSGGGAGGLRGTGSVQATGAAQGTGGGPPGTGAAPGTGGGQGTGAAQGTGGGQGTGAAQGTGGAAPGDGCENAGDCRLVVEACCLCEWPTLDQASAVPFDSERQSLGCPTCGGCATVQAEPPAAGVDCVAGQCQVLDVRTAALTECTHDDDCVLAPYWCCEQCADIEVVNSYAVRRDSAWLAERCLRELPACPLVDCSGGQVRAEPYCDAGRCRGRSL